MGFSARARAPIMSQCPDCEARRCSMLGSGAPANFSIITLGSLRHSSPKVAPMRYLAHVFLALVLYFPIAQASAEEHTFAHHDVEGDAERYETYLKANWLLAGRDGPALRAEGNRTLATDPRAASRSFAGAVVADGQDAAAWLGLGPRVARDHARPRQGQRALRPAGERLGRRLPRLPARAGNAIEGQRTRRSRRRIAAALLLAPRHRRS